MSPTIIDPQQATTVLFVPGSRPDRFSKALASGADAILIDLEDSVAPEDRPTARRAILDFFVSNTDASLWVRINGAGTPDHYDDLALIAQLVDNGTPPAAVVLAKAERVSDVEHIKAEAGRPVIALVESAAGYAAARDLARAVAPLGRLALGAIDLALDIGSSAPSVVDTVAIEIVIASRLAEITPPLASPSVSISDQAAVSSQVRHAQALGFGGALCIHPRQVATAAAAFVPTPGEVAWAKRVATAGADAVQIDGAMVDAPVLARARLILERASAEELGDASNR